MIGLVEKFYDEKAETYDQMFQRLVYKTYDEITWKYLEPYLPQTVGALVLDAGGGTGRWAIRIAKKGNHVVLMDISRGMLKIARKRAKQCGVSERITLKHGNIGKIDYPDDTFDLILCEHALFLIEDVNTVIEALVRVLKKGSPLIISAQNTYVTGFMYMKENKLDEAKEVLLSNVFTFHKTASSNEQIQAQLFTPKQFVDLLNSNGLKVKKIVGKLTTMLGWSMDFFNITGEKANNILSRLLEIELMLCEKTELLELSGHFQAIAYKI